MDIAYKSALGVPHAFLIHKKIEAADKMAMFPQNINVACANRFETRTLFGDLIDAADLFIAQDIDGKASAGASVHPANSSIEMAQFGTSLSK